MSLKRSLLNTAKNQGIFVHLNFEKFCATVENSNMINPHPTAFAQEFLPSFMMHSGGCAVFESAKSQVHLIIMWAPIPPDRVQHPSCRVPQWKLGAYVVWWGRYHISTVYTYLQLGKKNWRLFRVEAFGGSSMVGQLLLIARFDKVTAHGKAVHQICSTSNFHLKFNAAVGTNSLDLFGYFSIPTRVLFLASRPWLTEKSAAPAQGHDIPSHVLLLTLYRVTAPYVCQNPCVICINISPWQHCHNFQYRQWRDGLCHGGLSLQR